MGRERAEVSASDLNWVRAERDVAEEKLKAAEAARTALRQWVHDELLAYSAKTQQTDDPHEKRYWEGWTGCLYNLRNKLGEGARDLADRLAREEPQQKGDANEKDHP